MMINNLSKIIYMNQFIIVFLSMLVILIITKSIIKNETNNNHDITLDFPYEKMIIENDNENINDIIINFMIRIDINIYDNDNKKIDFISRHLESTGGINRSRICVGNNFDLGNSGRNAN